MKTFIFPSNDDWQDDPLGNEKEKEKDLQNLQGKSAELARGSLVRHTYDNASLPPQKDKQKQPKRETWGDETNNLAYPHAEEEDDEWPYDGQTKAMMSDPNPLKPRMTS